MFGCMSLSHAQRCKTRIKASALGADSRRGKAYHSPVTAQKWAFLG